MNMKRFGFSSLSMVMLSLVLSGCGGDSVKAEPDAGDDTEVVQPVTKTFTVSLSAVQVTRKSTGEAIEIEIGDVSSSATLTTKP